MYSNYGIKPLKDHHIWDQISRAFQSAEPATPSSQPPAENNKAHQNPQLDAKNGFQEFIFGTAASQYTDVARSMFDKSTDDDQTYAVTDPKRNVGGIEIHSIHLDFKQGLLQSIWVQVNGRENVAGFIVALTQAYGQPVRSGAFSKTLKWEGDRVRLSVGVVNDDWAAATFESNEIEAKIKADVEQKAKAGAAVAAKQL